MNEIFDDALIDGDEAETTNDVHTYHHTLTDTMFPKTDKLTDNIEDSKENELPYPITNEDNSKLYCQVCGKLYVSITQTHLTLHKMSTQEYRDKFKTPIVSEKHKNHLSAVNTKKFREVFKKEIEEPKKEIIEENEVTIDEVDLSSMVDKFDDKLEWSQNVKDVKPIDMPYNDPAYTKTNLAYEIEEVIQRGAVKENYFIEEIAGSGSFPGTVQLKYSYISDLAIPDLKVAFFFPDTYWHNREIAPDPNKYNKLREDGWKTITVKGNAPTIDDIIPELQNQNII